MNQRLFKAFDSESSHSRCPSPALRIKPRLDRLSPLRRVDVDEPALLLKMLKTQISQVVGGNVPDHPHMSFTVGLDRSDTNHLRNPIKGRILKMATCQKE